MAQFMKGNLTIFTMSLKYYTSLLNSISNNYLKCETEERKPLFLFFGGFFGWPVRPQQQKLGS